MPKQVVGPTISLVREPYTCVDCGVQFPLGKGTATKRCPDCRARHNRERPDRRINRQPITCPDCSSEFQPSNRGKVPTRCPRCRKARQLTDSAEYSRDRRAAAAVGLRPRDIRADLPSRNASCLGCGTPFEHVAARGPLPTVCKGCRRRKNRDSARMQREAVRASGERPWLKVYTCRDCGVVVPPAAPGQRRRSRCEECWLKHRKPYQKDSAKNREKHLRRHFGMTVAEYKTRRAAQDGRCAICGYRPETSLHVDHDHESRKVRGLLCGSCNRMLGLAKDDPTRLAAAIEYLARYAGTPPPDSS